MTITFYTSHRALLRTNIAGCRAQLLFSSLIKKKKNGCQSSWLQILSRRWRSLKMRRGFLLVTLFLVVKLRCSQSRCEEPGSRRATSDVGGVCLFIRGARWPRWWYSSLQAFNVCFSRQQQTVGLDNLRRNILKRYSDLDYDSFVGLMGRRNAGEFFLFPHPNAVHRAHRGDDGENV